MEGGTGLGWRIGAQIHRKIRSRQGNMIGPASTALPGDFLSMKSFATLVALAGLVMLGATGRGWAEEPVDKTVDYLIESVANSGLTFIRNGSEHTAAEAAALMRRKLAHVKDEVKTPEDFIRLAASQSHLTGKPYLVKWSDGKTLPSAEWLTGLLRKHRAAASD
jgi:hypothetical protein